MIRGQTPQPASCMPPKKRPRLPDYEPASGAAPLDLSAKSAPVLLTSAAPPHPTVQQLTPPGLAAMPDSQWQAAAAAAMYAQYMASYLNSLMPPPPPPPLPPPLLSQPPQLASSLDTSPSAHIDFSCACGRRFANLIGLTVHMQTAGHCSGTVKDPEAAVAVMEPAAPRAAARELPKLVRGQDMWINSETEQTREILRCIRCRQSYRTLPELTLHMVRSKHYAEIINSGASSSSAASPPATASASGAISPRTKPLTLAKSSDSPKPAAPAYLCPDLAPSPTQPLATLGNGDSNPLSCLQRLVDRTAAFADASLLSCSTSAAAVSAAAAAAPAASPSAASTSSTSEAASVIVPPGDDQLEPRDEAVRQSPLLPQLMRQKPALQQQQLQQQQHQLTQKKKTKCQFCARPFANKGQVRLHVSKGKCPGAAAGAAAVSSISQQPPLPAPPPQQPGLAFFEYFFGGANPAWWRTSQI